MTMHDHDLAHRFGIDPAGTLRQLGRAQGRDAEDIARPQRLDRPGVRVSPETMARRSEIYAETRDRLRPVLVVAVILACAAVYFLALSTIIERAFPW
jgi:hypothetical protein